MKQKIKTLYYNNELRAIISLYNSFYHIFFIQIISNIFTLKYVEIHNIEKAFYDVVNFNAKYVLGNLSFKK